MARELARRPLDVGDPAAVLAGMRAVLETPLGPPPAVSGWPTSPPPTGSTSWSSSCRSSAETCRAGALTLDAVADLLHAHVPAGTPLHGYADRLRDDGCSATCAAT